MSITSARFIVLVLSLLYIAAVFCLSSSGVTALPVQPKQTSNGTSTGSSKISNLHVTKNKQESSDHQTTKKPVINQGNTRMVTSKKSDTQKISENLGESTIKKNYTQKMSGTRNTGKQTRQSSNSSNSSSSTSSNSSSSTSSNRSSSTSSNSSSSTSSNSSSSSSTNSSSNGTKKDNNNTNRNSINISSSNKTSNNSSISSNGSLPIAAKTSLRTDSKNFNLSSDFNPTSEVFKRSSEIKMFAIDSENTRKPIEIEVKTYTAPSNTSAIIEVRPKELSIYEIDARNYPYDNSWPLYQMYPYSQEINGPQNWFMQQYKRSLPSTLTYVPTEELLHGQSFTNTPSLSSQLLYQYPVKEAIHNKPVSSLRSQPSHNSQHIVSKLLNNKVKISNPDAKNDHKLLPNYAEDPFALISPYEFNKPLITQYSLPQNYISPYFHPHSYDIQKSFYIQDEANLNNRPTVTKYVTNSYVLKTSPKLEWVSL